MAMHLEGVSLEAFSCLKILTTKQVQHGHESGKEDESGPEITCRARGILLTSDPALYQIQQYWV